MMDRARAGELLLYYLGLEGGESVGQPASPPEWDRLVERSIRYNVAPLLYRRLKALGSSPDPVPGNSNTDAVPGSVLQRLRESYLQNALKNMRLYHELANTVRILHSEGIPVIVLKGAHLARIVYGNIALRRMCDLDLLVRKGDLPGTVERLLKAGYRPSKPFEIEDLCATRHHLPQLVKEGAAPIEIHWTIHIPGSPFTVDVDGLWNRARPVIINDVQMMVLSPEDLILHLCLHATQHIFDIGLRPLLDLSETMRRYRGELDWEQLRLRSHQWRMSRPFYLMMYLLRELSGKAVPEELMILLEPDHFDTRFVAGCKAHIIMRLNGSGGPALTPDLAQFWKSGSFHDKLILFLEKIFPSRQRLAKYYHLKPDSSLIYLYYPVHLKYLLMRYSRTMWRLLHHDKEAVTLAGKENSQVVLKDWLKS